jgi:dolichol-phosphate mannosyltransferase/undecaprenyl-phosphate 4-deoxy-4-formamido-L-arabinose transferase
LLQTRIDKVFKEDIREEYEIIFINDGSSNLDTWPVLKELAQTFLPVKALNLTANYGKHSALLAGFEYCKGDYIITMDDDLQHLPEDIPTLINEKSHDVVVARFKKKKHPPLKKLTSQIYAFLELLFTPRPLSITNGPFKMMKRWVAEACVKNTSYFPNLSVYIYGVSKDVVNVPATHAPREFGNSGFTFSRLAEVAFGMIASNKILIFKLLFFSVSLLIPAVIAWGLHFSFVWLFLIPGILLFVFSIVSLYFSGAFTEKNKPFSISEFIS